MEIERLPELDRPNFIAAFQGWNDAGQSATTAVRYLIDSWKAQRFAQVDPEDYFSFTDTRPTIRIVDGAERKMTWPSIEFYAFEGNTTSPAAILMVGSEPNLRWKSFSAEVLRLARSLEAQRVFTLGSLVTDSVHTRPVPITGFSTDADIQEKLSGRSITRSSYEGPTGIVGVLHDACRNAQMPTASIWASTPYYLGTTPNPKTALSLLDTIDEVLDLHLNLTELRVVADEFVRQVSGAVQDNTDVAERIRSLEEAYDAAGGQAQGGPPQFPPTGSIIADLESFLREQRDDG
jgi:proteasome assembly chaperone (PAC2) family protein